MCKVWDLLKVPRVSLPASNALAEITVFHCVKFLNALREFCMRLLNSPLSSGAADRCGCRARVLFCPRAIQHSTKSVCSTHGKCECLLGPS